VNHQLRTGLTLGFSVLAAILVLSLAERLTRDRIEQSQRDFLLSSLSAVLPDGPFDSDPLASRRMIIAPALGSPEPLAVYTLFQDQRPVAAILSVIAPDGYNGNIELLVGVSYAGKINGVRVTHHRETPGLGDDIDSARSDWINQFSGQSLQSSTAGDWTVKKAAGRFDAFTGATITPRAVITAIHRALIWFEAHRDLLFDTK
jgi:electron transport complex protein RnfG